MKYYGTAIPEPPGTGIPAHLKSEVNLAYAVMDERQADLYVEQLLNEDWCDQANCPRTECVECKKEENAN
jgi:hypothetical protein